ncbi:MAG: class C sortase [Clostridia bacterium]
MSKKLSNFLLFIILTLGVCLLLYPTLSNYYNSFHQSKAIVTYEESLVNIDDQEYTEMFASAVEYNEQLAKLSETDFINGEPEDEVYQSLLSVNDDSIMGYIEIESIDVKLAIYHGTSDSVLSIGVGHLEGSSLPIGGESTHTVLTGHRGLTSSKLFTDLDELSEGDIFTLTILGTVLTYQIQEISIVEPYEITDLNIVQGEDLCTLVTCTPYGVNSQRLLITGIRIDNIDETERIYVSTEAILIEPLVVAPILAAPILLMMAIWIIFKPSKNKKIKKN